VSSDAAAALTQPQAHRSQLRDPADRHHESPRLTVIFTVISMAILMSAIDQTIVATALHALQNGLNTSINWAGWTITIYSLTRIIIFPVAGKLSDQYGRRRVFLFSVVLFTVASLACGFANNIYVLIALRTLQAIGGAAFAPSAAGIIVEHFGPARDKVLGLFASIFPVGEIIGPIAGGILVSTWSWRGVFFVNVPVGIVLTWLAIRYLPRDRRPAGSADPDSRGIDVAGMALLAVGLLCAMLGMSFLAEGGRAWTEFLLLEAAAAGVLGWFVVRARRQADPLIPPRLLYGRGFGVMNLINFTYGAVAFGLGALIPLYATERYGLDPLDSGTLLSARGVAVIIVGVLAALVLRRTGYRRPIVVGVLVIAGGTALLAVPTSMSAYAWLVIAAGITGIGIGAIGPAANTAAVQLAPESAAATTGLRIMFDQAGSIVAISATTAVLTVSDHPGTTLGTVFVVAAGVLVSLVAATSRIPDHRGSW
jgi:EmrB/QacA subfamily drug resistance transporter